MKKLAALLLALLMLPLSCLGEGTIINLIDNPEAEYSFEEGKEIFTIVYPNIHGSDAAILMYQGEVWEKQILSLRFVGGKTQMEVAGSLGISQAQVSRLEKSAIGTMRKSVSVVVS